MNIFEETYEKFQQLKIVGRTAKSDNEKEEARQLLSKVISCTEKFGFYDCYIWREYENSRDCGNSKLNLAEIIWNHQISGIVACMKANDIKEFTFSGTYSNALETAWLFQQEGCVLEGMVKIFSTYTDANGEHTEVPALLFKIK